MQPRLRTTHVIRKKRTAKEDQGSNEESRRKAREIQVPETK